jgi:hypothetical protein
VTAVIPTVMIAMLRFIGDDLERHEVPFTGLTLPSFVFDSTVPLGSTWLDILHTDDESWQENTPNTRIALDELPTEHTITPQGWIEATTNPNHDNVGLWLHDDSPASASWSTGNSNTIGYWLLAQDNKPEPWADLGLRSELTFLNFEDRPPAQDNSPEPWADLGLRSGLTFLDFKGNTCTCEAKYSNATAAVTPIFGYTDTALQLDYDLGTNTGNNIWVQIRCDFSQPLDLLSYDHLRFDWRGSPTDDPTLSNSLQVGMVDTNGNHFAKVTYRHVVHHSWWGQLVIPFSLFEPSDNGTPFDSHEIKGIFFSVVKTAKNPEDPNDVDDIGGTGSIAIDNLNAYKVVSPDTVPGDFETVVSNPVAAQKATSWIASWQQSTGLVKSWEEEGTCVAHTYDQALALIVFADHGIWSEADALVDVLAAIQNPDGSWYKSYDCVTLDPVHTNKWEGDIAWAVYALRRYLDLGGTHTQAETALQNGASWLADPEQFNSAEGCLKKDHTEGTIDAWWAFQAAGASHAGDAESIKNCLLTYYWDDEIGRFNGDRDPSHLPPYMDRWHPPYLDNQTWGAAFLKAIGETEKARRALRYARDVLRVPAQGGQLFGFDGNAGPWSVWNEGTAQYVAVGGEGANDFLQEPQAQQREDGAMPGSPDKFTGSGVWTTRWHGIAPTSWLYFALSDEPFHVHAMSTLYSIASQDGWVLESAEKSNKGGSINASASTLRLGDDKTKKQYRSILSFSTKGLPDDAVITKVTLKVRRQGVIGGGNPVTTFQGFMVDIKKGYFGTSALQTADFQTTASKTYGPFKPALSSNWYSIDLTGGKSYINKSSSYSGLTQIRLRFKLDDNNNTIANYLSLYSGNASSSYRPQLIIEYYVP